MTNKNPFDILRKEHDKVLKILDNLESNLNKKDINQSKNNINLLQKEFNKHSLNKEEKVLFPEIEKFMPREGGPTGMMIIEHKDLTESIDMFSNERDSNKLADIGNHIINLLREHIDKENNMLFMMAEMHLDNKQKEIIIKKFKGIDLKK
ncbi:hemerythrin domain-containing protein [Candidatus Pacearchaeota archaeon]|nr:hemerythrin domain-containing protein [Candidatus Pacearchaeota archaeon]